MELLESIAQYLNANQAMIANRCSIVLGTARWTSIEHIDTKASL